MIAFYICSFKHLEFPKFDIYFVKILLFAVVLTSYLDPDLRWLFSKHVAG